MIRWRRLHAEKTGAGTPVVSIVNMNIKEFSI